MEAEKEDIDLNEEQTHIIDDIYMDKSDIEYILKEFNRDIEWYRETRREIEDIKSILPKNDYDENYSDDNELIYGWLINKFPDLDLQILTYDKDCRFGKLEAIKSLFEYPKSFDKKKELRKHAPAFFKKQRERREKMEREKREKNLKL